MHPTSQPALDRSLAIGIVTLPFVVVGFVLLAVAGWIGDWRAER